MLRSSHRPPRGGPRPAAALLVVVLLPAALFQVALFQAGCAGETRSVPFVNGTIDAFEDSDRRNALGNPWEAIAEGEGTYADLDIPAGGFTDAGHFLIFDGYRPEGATGAQVVGVRTSLLADPAAADPEREPLAADVSAFTGLAFAVKGTPGTYIVQLGSTQVSDFDFFNSYVEVTEEWSEFEIPFSRFRQEGFGRSVAWDPATVSHVALYANLTGNIRFSLDEVRFY